MSHFRFIHAADLHLDSPFRGMGGRTNIPEEIYRRIKNSTFQAFDNLVQLSIEQRVDFLLIAGDVFDLADRSLRAQTYFQKGMQRLAEKGIKVYVIHGNHDPEDGGKASLSWPDNVKFFSSQKVESATFTKDGREFARIYGRSYPTAKFTERIIDDYRKESQDSFTIGLLHTNLDGDPNHDNYAPCAKKDLIEKDFDYWALGHIHQREMIQEKEPAIAYAGNIQGRSVKETGAKGCYLVDVEDGEINQITFLETDDVRWYWQEVDLSGTGSLQQVFDMIYEALQDIAEESGNRPSIIRLELKGNTPVHRHLFPVEDFLEGLQPYLEEWTDRENWVWLESVRIGTRPDVSREDLLEGKGFVTDFLKLMDEIRDNPDEIAIIKDEVLHSLYKHRDGKKHLPPTSEEEIMQMIDEVEDMALRLFYEEEEDVS